MTDPNFYQLQNKWSKIYFRDVGESDFQKTRWVKQVVPHPFQKILELGAGGGQFSVALAEQNYSVTVLEKESDFVNHIEIVKREKSLANLRIIQADFYRVQINETFDLICYWDGFGVSHDQDQQHLLRKISNWLAPRGSFLLEVYTPWFWSGKVCGVERQMGDVLRKYDFDSENCCMVDTWWLKNDPSMRTSQKLRCYSPTDLQLLLSSTGLKMEEIYPGGFVDYETGEYLAEVPLHQAMSYTVRLVQKD